MTLPRSVEAVNLGLSTFADALRDQGAPVVEVDWRPPPADLVDVLTRLWGDRVAAANAEVVERIEAAAPCAVTVAPAGDVVPGLRDGLLLHSGPPIEWERVCDPQRRALIAAALFEGWASDREDAARRLGARRDRAGARQRARPRRPDDRRLLAVDAGLGGRGRRRAGLLDAQRGSRPHAVVRRRRRRVGRAAALLPRRAGPDAGAAARAPRAGRRVRARRPGPEHGRRAAHAQPGDRQPADARPAAGVRRARRRGVGALHQRQPPLLPQPDDGGVQVRVAGGRRRSTARASCR